jgi:protein SCO1/2
MRARRAGRRRELAHGDLNVTKEAPPKSRLKQVRLLLWLLVAVAAIGAAALWLVPQEHARSSQQMAGPVKSSFGGPFTLTAADGKSFSSQALAGKPYAMFFGFTRCGDVCPTTLGRLVKLRRTAANDQALHVVFVTIDPANDGPKEVGQYAGLFGAPIIGLTGTQAQIDQVKKQYGIHAEPTPHAGKGLEMMHTGSVLLFNRAGQFAGTISAAESDADAVAKLKKLVV